MNKYELVCGMEIHAELKTHSKMFCGCKNDPFNAPNPNIYTCPVCLGLPGALPVANAKAIEWTVKLGLALGCKINLYSKFDRKHYFYPDLPKGYQISQYDLPFCYDGSIETSAGTVRIRRIHLEEDTGKLLHKTVNGEKLSLIDFNRSSVPLVEIVTEPDITSAVQAAEYAKKLRTLLRSLDISDCDMEQGGMRLEANISLRPVGSDQLPAYKVELKNINSFRYLSGGIEYEIERQAKLLDADVTIAQETRGYNADKGTTFVQRSKEDAEDYRYFPDPDLPPIRFSQEQIGQWRSELPILPDAKMQEWVTRYGIDERFVTQFVQNRDTIELLDELFSQAADAKTLAGDLANKKISFPKSKNDIAQTLEEFSTLHRTISVDDQALSDAIASVLTENADVKARYQSGQQQLMGFVMGQVMRKLGKVDPNQVRSAIEKALSS